MPPRLFLWPALAVLIAALVAVQNVALERRSHFSAEEDLLFLPRPGALRAMALGHTELASDLVFIRAIIYFGAQFTDKGEYRWIDKYLETIVELDPAFKTPYRWAGVATIYNGRPITNEAVLVSNRFLERGVKQFPADWELPFMLGCNYLFELKPGSPAQRRDWKATGAAWIRHAALLSGAPPWISLLAATIMKEEGQDEAAVRHLEEVYLTTQDEATRKEIWNRLIGLKAVVDVRRAERGRKQLEDQHRRNLAYAPADFFVVMGPRPSPRMDLEWLGRHGVLDSTVAEGEAAEDAAAEGAAAEGEPGTARAP